MKRIYFLMAEFEDGSSFGEEREAVNQEEAEELLKELIRWSARGKPVQQSATACRFIRDKDKDPTGLASQSGNTP